VAPAERGQPQDTLGPALESLRLGRESRHFREALTLVNAHLNRAEARPDFHLSETTRSFLKETFQLEAAELEEIDAGSFRPLDAVHLDGAFLFAEAARALDVADLPALDRASAAFGWAMRRVLLHQQHDDGLPPYLVVKRGYGGPRDRALVFIELLRQLKLDACVIASPTADMEEAEALLVGVLIPKDKGPDVALFDVRLGLPVRNERGIATLAAAHANPKLVDVDMKKTEVRLALPLSALAPRMTFLQDALAAHVRVVLYQDAQALHKEVVAATGMKVSKWPTQPTGTPPWRLDRQFFPVNEGGVDNGARLTAFMTQLLPVSGTLYKLEELRLSKELPEEGRTRLIIIVLDLLGKYYQEPREMLLRGEHDAALKRLDRIYEVLAQDRDAEQLDETTFQQNIAKWRERMIRLDADKDVPGLERLWLEDQYLLAVRDVNGEKSPQEFERKLLTHIILRTCREQLTGAVDSIKAAIWEDKAARLEAHRGDGKKALNDRTANAWRNTAGAWGNFLDRADLGPTQQRQRLAQLSRQFQANQVEFALTGLEQLHVDLSRLWDARLRQAHAHEHNGQQQAAVASIKQVQSSLQALMKESDLKKLMDDLAAEKQLAPPLARRVNLLYRDWTPLGNFHWVGQRAQTMLKSLDAR
jgi:hypothetical protein